MFSMFSYIFYILLCILSKEKSDNVQIKVFALNLIPCLSEFAMIHRVYGVNINFINHKCQIMLGGISVQQTIDGLVVDVTSCFRRS